METSNQKCVACAAQQLLTERYDRQWCPKCLQALQFEEKQAEQAGGKIKKVVLHNGHLLYLIEGPPDLDVSEKSLGDAMRELADAVRAVRESVTVVGGRVGAISAATLPSVDVLSAVLTRYRPLMSGEPEFDEFFLVADSWINQVRDFVNRLDHRAR